MAAWEECEVAVREKPVMYEEGITREGMTYEAGSSKSGVPKSGVHPHGVAHAHTAHPVASEAATECHCVACYGCRANR
jgi:hypothetical protein